ncbi:MAG: hypothetical protein H0U44_04935 [Flavisolibacter sp.]|jgi:hypothetical protein|nr:hypothetical protein [Flavisolibacter sp.]
MWKLIFLFFLIMIFSGCNMRERERQLDQRSAALDQKEQELVLKERSLQLKEEELLKKEQQADSIKLVDTTAVYNPGLVGIWSVRMVGTEATCPGSAVGDTKTETWHLSYQNNNILVKAMTGDQLVRVYSGTYNGKTIELSEDRESSAATPSTSMIVRLRIMNQNLLEGQREILRDAQCKIVYSVQMTRQ